MTDADTIRTFLTAGVATFTLESHKTRAHLTFQVQLTPQGNAWFVRVLTGPDNTADYSYMGLMTEDSQGRLGVRETAKTRISKGSTSFQAMQWLLGRLNAGRGIAPEAELHHMGRCARCNRELTHPESIKTGLGPECAKRV